MHFSFSFIRTGEVKPLYFQSSILIKTKDCSMGLSIEECIHSERYYSIKKSQKSMFVIWAPTILQCLRELRCSAFLWYTPLQRGNCCGKVLISPAEITFKVHLTAVWHATVSTSLNSDLFKHAVSLCSFWTKSCHLYIYRTDEIDLDSQE